MDLKETICNAVAEFLDMDELTDTQQDSLEIDTNILEEVIRRVVCVGAASKYVLLTIEGNTLQCTKGDLAAFIEVGIGKILSRVGLNKLVEVTQKDELPREVAALKQHVKRVIINTVCLYINIHNQVPTSKEAQLRISNLKTKIRNDAIRARDEAEALG